MKRKRFAGGQGPRTEVLFIRAIPVNVKARFKAHCAARGQTMTDTIIAMMREAVERQTYIDTRGRPRSGAGVGSI